MILSDLEDTITYKLINDLKSSVNKEMLCEEEAISLHGTQKGELTILCLFEKLRDPIRVVFADQVTEFSYIFSRRRKTKMIVFLVQVSGRSFFPLLNYVMQYAFLYIYYFFET